MVCVTERKAAGHADSDAWRQIATQGECLVLNFGGFAHSSVERMADLTGAGNLSPPMRMSGPATLTTHGLSASGLVREMRSPACCCVFCVLIVCCVLLYVVCVLCVVCVRCCRPSDA